MSLELKKQLEKQFNADGKSLSLIIDHLRPISLPDGAELLVYGDVCKKVYYVVSGALQVYQVSEDNKERTLDLSISNEWCSDIISFSTERPSLENIRAVGDTQVLEIDKQGLNILMDRVPGFRQVYRGILEEILRRNDGFISLGQKARIAWMKKHRPSLVEHIPMAIIASYLGISEELLQIIH